MGTSSFFGTQEGEFSLSVRSISAYRGDAEDESGDDTDDNDDIMPYKDDAGSTITEKANRQTAGGFWTKLFESCTDCVRRR